MSEDLLKRIKENDQEAFERIIEKYKQMVFSVAIGFTHDKNAAEDITQDVFIKLWEIRKDFTLTSKLSTWLYRVTANMSINYIKKQKFSTAFSFFKNSDDDDNKKPIEHKLNDYEPSAEEKFRQEHIKHALKNAVNSLPKNQRIAFVLNKYQDMSYKEIAEVMELSLSSVEALLHRAKKNLQKKLFDVYKNLNN